MASNQADDAVVRRRGSHHSKAAIDAWASFGSPGWDWKTLGPYFRKFHSLSRPSPETCKHLRLDYIDDDVRGTDGPVQASFPETDDPVPAAWVDTLAALGFPASGDPFSAEFLAGNNIGRPNLHVSTGALAEKIIFDTSGKIPKATGIQISRDGTTSVLTARREVILAAGVFCTPKLLELSGNPNVGENLQDHPNTGVSFEVADGVKTKVGLSRQEPEAINEAMQDYINRKRGVANIFTYAACGKSPNRFIDYEMSIDLVPKGAGSSIITQAAESGNFITVSTAPLFPLSRGYSHINSTDVSAKPTIDPRYMMHPLDVEVKAYIKTSTLSCWHPTSACALLPRERGGVVDPQLQVYGVDGLRIVDSSVIPVQTRGNTQTTVYAVAERPADLIKDSL
ncbi:hypothetical protein F5883DRAFT_606387 [Diaporthe sp. PMI_573]|nr:hypothetical protein F5883DRAFT_606387 [Diaporthaceae sp. PMI_573]